MSLKQIINVALGAVHLDSGLIKPGDSKVVDSLVAEGNDIKDALLKGWIRVVDFVEQKVEQVEEKLEAVADAVSEKLEVLEEVLEKKVEEVKSKGTKKRAGVEVPVTTEVDSNK